MIKPYKPIIFTIFYGMSDPIAPMTALASPVRRFQRAHHWVPCGNGTLWNKDHSWIMIHMIHGDLPLILWRFMSNPLI